MKYKMKVVLAGALLSTSVFTQAVELSGNVSAVSDYRFRGWSQTDNNPALQGGLDLSFDSGFYVGTWASNIAFTKDWELDAYAGYAADLSKDFTIDSGFIYYGYPGTDGVDTALSGNIKENYAEFYSNLSYKDLTIGLAYSDDYFLESGEFYYLSADYSFSLPHEISLGLHYGVSELDLSGNDSNAKDAEVAFLGGGEDSYADWSVSLTKEVAGIELGLSWVDTDLSREECFDASSPCGGGFIFSASKAFDL